ncbi:lytic polysaccharide monooxygenase, partial [Streptococcus pneumoniae]|uniref:lytic polysaccharide monooxygenase n=3 Tax=Bacteria TaxID=2 RepID=UPI0013D9664D
TTPVSRVYACFQGNPENPTNPACAAAKAVGGSQAFYDWNGINQANANGNHQAVVPDGKLCSGNNATFRGLD